MPRAWATSCATTPAAWATTNSITSSVRSADLTGVVTEGAEAMGVSLCSAGLF
jgi:hypothetical protein